MDSQDYLDQISKQARPVKPPKKGVMGILTSNYFKWGMGALALLIVIMIFGSILGSRTTVEERCTDLKLHIDRTVKVMDEFQPSVKSSLLRSLSASLKGVFMNTSSQMNTFMVNAYKYDERNAKQAMVEEADLNADALTNELFEAKINGLLDRTYAHKMALEIYTVMSNEAGISNATDNAELKSILSTSYDSLNNLYTQFNDFSETK